MSRLGCCSLHWDVVVCIGMLCCASDVVVCFGILWLTSGYCGVHRDVVVYIGVV